MRDYLFYGAGMKPRRLPWLVVPARRTLRRLLRPVFYRQVELFKGLDSDIEELRSEVHELRAAIERVDSRVQSIAALGWDHVAMTRRLAAIEDSFVDRDLQVADANLDIATVGARSHEDGQN